MAVTGDAPETVTDTLAVPAAALASLTLNWQLMLAPGAIAPIAQSTTDAVVPPTTTLAADAIADVLPELVMVSVPAT